VDEGVQTADERQAAGLLVDGGGADAGEFLAAWG
jgi:hypothetical protein